MARRQSSIGFLGRFGRSSDLVQLDNALRAADLHPAQVPEGVKLAIVNLMKDYYEEEPPPQAYAEVAALFAYCAVGPNVFEQSNGGEAARLVERRIDTAIAQEDSPDARLILLSLHSRLVSPATLSRFDLRAEPE